MIRDNDLASTAAAAIWAGGDMKDDEDNRTTPFPIMVCGIISYMTNSHLIFFPIVVN